MASHHLSGGVGHHGQHRVHRERQVHCSAKPNHHHQQDQRKKIFSLQLFSDLKFDKNYTKYYEYEECLGKRCEGQKNRI